ncbi:macro domain-containing protein [Allobaculum sp. Allo2]|uniref:macro domain-containing protein n=1 Tax=Allobaculum sp. Allo2 TaxID=2853432 RepID=UPI001F61DABC|nr:macro domain-containing protein [Allobaculum sp. Allo2]UNT92154.1 hypothetical protein KWG61_07850 [Allobaculum sp. Allo2]
MPEKELFRKVDLEHGGQAYCAFLTVPEDQEGPAAEYRPVKAEEIFRAALEDPDCEGLILNPWDLSAMLTHELLALVLNEDGRSASCSLYINYGEVCDQDCDVIANIAEHPFEETEHDPKLIFDRGGEALRSVCAKLTPPKPGQIVVTSSGIGRSASIFHAALPEVIREESLHQLIDAILERALHMGYTSVSLPSIGNEIAPYLPEGPFAVLAVSGWFCRHPDSGMSVTISTRSKKRTTCSAPICSMISKTVKISTKKNLEAIWRKSICPSKAARPKTRRLCQKKPEPPRLPINNRRLSPSLKPVRNEPDRPAKPKRSACFRILRKSVCRFV